MKTTELLKVLENTKAGIDTKSETEIMSYYYFSKNNVITHNDKISVRYPFKTDFNMFVKATDLYNIISKIKTSEVSLTKKENKLNISSKSAKINLTVIEDDEATSMIENVSKSIKEANWKKLPENFKESIKLCATTTSIHDSDGTLSYIYLDGVDCISSDNTRISHSILDSQIDQMFIKAKEVNSLINSNPIEYSIGDSWIHFKNEDNGVFSIRVITGEYPDYLQFFDFDGDEITLSKDVLTGIDLASVLTDIATPIINIKIEKGFCILSVKSDNGKILHRSKVNYKGNPINFMINPNFLKEMINHSTSLIVGSDKAKLKTDKFSLLTLFFS